MLKDVKAEDVRKLIEDGETRCKGVQESITKESNKRASESRLSVRQVWAAKRKKLQALLDVLELE